MDTGIGNMIGIMCLFLLVGCTQKQIQLLEQDDPEIKTAENCDAFEFYAEHRRSGESDHKSNTNKSHPKKPPNRQHKHIARYKRASSPSQSARLLKKRQPDIMPLATLTKTSHVPTDLPENMGSVTITQSSQQQKLVQSLPQPVSYILQPIISNSIKSDSIKSRVQAIIPTPTTPTIIPPTPATPTIPQSAPEVAQIAKVPATTEPPKPVIAVPTATQSAAAVPTPIPPAAALPVPTSPSPSSTLDNPHVGIENDANNLDFNALDTTLDTLGDPTQGNVSV